MLKKVKLHHHIGSKIPILGINSEFAAIVVSISDNMGTVWIDFVEYFLQNKYLKVFL